MLFDATDISGLTLRNRIVRSATWEGLAANDGSPAPRLLEISRELAAGGVGLVITGHAYVNREGRASATQLGADHLRMLPSLRELAWTTQAAGAKIALQIAHAGCHAVAHLDSLTALGPSRYENIHGEIAREMSEEDIAEVTRAFGRAAALARSAGFDGVQIHAAHGFLLSQFLSPYFNRRKDDYGGGLGGRARLLREVARSVRTAVGPGFPVLVKLNSEDFLPSGFSVGEMLETVAALEEEGIDAVELSGGTNLSGKFSFCRVGRPRPGEPEAYYEAAARQLKRQTHLPVMLVGGIRTFQTAERLVDDGVTDYVCLSRPLIREPDLALRWRSGDTRPALCDSDNACFKPARQGEGLSCVTDARQRRHTRFA